MLCCTYWLFLPVIYNSTTFPSGSAALKNRRFTIKKPVHSAIKWVMYVLVIYVYRIVLQRLKGNRISMYLLFSDSANIFSNLLLQIFGQKFIWCWQRSRQWRNRLTKNPFERSDIPKTPQIGGFMVRFKATFNWRIFEETSS